MENVYPMFREKEAHFTGQVQCSHIILSVYDFKSNQMGKRLSALVSDCCLGCLTGKIAPMPTGDESILVISYI